MNKEERKDYGKKATPLYYYDWKEYGRRTVCLLIDDLGTLIAKGVAVCSPKDQFVKRTGRVKARGKAIQALVKGELEFNVVKRIGDRYVLISAISPFLLSAWEATLWRNFLKAKHPQLYAKELRASELKNE